MMFAKLSTRILAGLAVVAITTAALADFEITSYTIDGGGGYSAGGQFEIEGTIGQTDAGPAGGAMVGGAFELTGGFWTTSSPCSCPGDMNGSGGRDGLDISQFVICVIEGGNCACADVDAANGVNIDDVALFVESLLDGAECP